MAHTFSLEFQAAWKILLIGLILGAGLPTLFATGIRSMAYGAGEVDGSGTVSGAHPAARVIGMLCFAVVLLVVVLGIVFIVATGFGKALSFEHIYPTIVSKS